MPSRKAPAALLLAAIGLTSLAALAAPATTAARPAGPARPAATARLLASDCVGVSRAVQTAVPWAQQQFRPTSVWGLTKGAGQTVAVLDSGVSAAAPALAGAVLPGLNTSTGHSADTDCAGHGTFVAGLIAGHPTAGSGFTGLAPQARILPVNVINANGDATAAAVAAGIRYAVSHGATIIDVCPAQTSGPSPALQAAVAYAQASNVLVIAAVNAGGVNGANQVSYPAAYPGVIAVTAVDAGGTPQAAAGAGVQPTLAGPGYEVTSIGPLGPGEVTASGTALATGFVAGTAALVRSYYPGLSAARVAARMEATADPPGDSVPDPEVGFGVVDPYNAVTTVLGTRVPAVPSPRPVRLPPLARPDTWPTTATVLICLGVALAVVGALAGAPIIRHGRRRQWQSPPVTTHWQQSAVRPGTRRPPGTRPKSDRSAAPQA
jgi:membrane-anchored mycosin MYCP